MEYLFLAGIGNSEPEHWQSIWYRSLGPHGHWVEHEDWDNPTAEAWVREFDRALRAVKGPKVLVAHSLACLMVAEWAKQHQDPDIAAALMVSVPDAAGPSFPKQAVGFAHAHEGRLPFAAQMVASANDPYGSVAYARRMADHWRVPLLEVGEKGHINLASKLGEWAEGRALLERLVATATAKAS
jgi:predicted alpha/beta hydrolase family esterase